MTRKAASSVLAFALVLASVLSSAAAVKNPDAFVYAAVSAPESLDPAWAYDMEGQNVIANVYESLLTFRGGGVSTRDLAPLLSEKVPSRANGLISADGLTYRFPIRKGVKFHDGTALTPEDVRYSLLRFLLLDRDGGPSSLLLQPILGLNTTRPGGKLLDDAYDRAARAVTTDGGDVLVRLNKPFAPFLGLLTDYGYVVSKKWCAAHGQWDGEAASWKKFNNPLRQDTIPDSEANGTGPFKLVRDDLAAREIVLARNDAYWRAPARLARVHIKVVDDFGTRKLMLQAGDADAIYADVQNLPQLQNLPGVTIIDGLAGLERKDVMLLAFSVNTAGNHNIGSGKLDGEGIPPNFFSDKEIRRAFAHSIDYDAYVKEVLRGRGSHSAGVIPAGLLGHKSGPARYGFDLKKAEEAFRKAWGGKVWEKGFKISVVYHAGENSQQVLAQMLKKNVESLNPRFRVEARGLAKPTVLEQSDRHMIPLSFGSWQADYPDPNNFVVGFLHSSGYYPSQLFYSNPRMDALIESAASELNEAKRAALYRRVQDLADEDLPVVPVADGASFRVQRSWVKGFVFKPIFPDMPRGSDYYDLSKSER